MPDPARQDRPLVFGEVLFDVFPDGSEVLGGAPFNVAWHLQGFGLAPLLVSRVGADERGERIVATMRAWGMDTGGIQRDDRRPTGIVCVTLRDGQPEFDIVADQAWDHVDGRTALAAAGTDGVLLYHGTLALRAPTSRAALNELRRRFAAPVCIDVNLRPPWWERERVAGLLDGAAWAKLNDAELETMIGERLADADDLECAGDVLRRHHRIGTLVVTRGAHGALVIDAGGVHHGEPAPVGTLVDTVGAGDAFSAVALLGLARGWPAARMLPRALRFASDICAQRGATAPDRALYERHLGEWNDT